MSNPVPESIKLSHMTEEQFNIVIQKGYEEMLAGKGRPIDCVFNNILTNNIETILDEADLQAKSNPTRYTHEDVFSSIRKIIQIKKNLCPNIIL